MADKTRFFAGGFFVAGAGAILAPDSEAVAAVRQVGMVAASVESGAGTTADQEASSSNAKLEADAASSDAAHLAAWNEFDKSSNTVLSSANHIATSSTPPSTGGVRATRGHALTGKYYFELRVSDANSINQFNIYGIATPDESLNNAAYNGSDNFRGFILGIYGGGGHFDMGAVTIRFAVDFTRNEYLVASTVSGPEVWYGPFSLGPNGKTKVWYPFFGFSDPGPAFAGHTGQVTLNEGDSAFQFAIPAGFQAWGGGEEGDSCAPIELDAIFVAVGNPAEGGSASDNQSGMRSTDGFNWSLEHMPENGASAIGFEGVAHSPELNRFVAVAPQTNSGGGNAGSAANEVATSPDGITWTKRAASDNANWRSVAWSPDLRLFCAVANGGTGPHFIMTSPDGITWTGRDGATSAGWNRIIWNAALGLFMINGNDMQTSPDGINWTLGTGDTLDANAIACNDDGRSIALGFGGIGDNVSFSDDGLAWTHATPISHDGWIRACWSSELGIFAAISDGRGGPTSQWATSPDGETWTVGTIPGTTEMRSIIWSRTLQMFLAVGAQEDGFIMSSTDGQTWVQVTAPDATPWNDLVEGILRHESPSSELESEIGSLQRASSDKEYDDAASSDNPEAKSSDDALSSDREAQEKASDDAASSAFQHEQASSSDAILDEQISSDKFFADQASSSNFEQASSDNDLLEQASSSDKPANDAASSEFQSDIEDLPAPPIQVVVVITT